MEPNPQTPGWYPDPNVGAPPGQMRYWTGRFWSVQVSSAPATPAPGPMPERARASTSRARRGWAVALIGLAVVALVAVGGYFVTRPTKSYPKAWDRQVAPIADQVQSLRGLDFEHPVPVRYLTDEEFRKHVGVESSKLSPEARRKIADTEGTLRAFGLLDADTDLVKSVNTVNQAGVLAFYDPEGEEIVVRGVGPLDIERKATLAHELTHVLQDQHFDLQGKRSDAESSDVSSSSALTALVEGDAERIKLAYLRGLPEADRAAYAAAEAKTGDSVGGEVADAAEIVKIEISAPYIFGPDLLNVITTQGGNDAVDDALRRDAPTDAVFLDPASALADPKAVRVPNPSVDKRDRRVGEPDHVGAFDLLTVLASRLDRQVALDAADAWAGDSMVTYRSADAICVRATFEGSTATGADTLAGALDAWAATMPGATVSRDPGHRRATLTSCDTGGSVPDASRLEGALQLLGGRNSILAALLAQDLPVPVSRCVSAALVKTPVFVTSLQRGGALTAAEQDEARRTTAALVGQCGGPGSS